MFKGSEGLDSCCSLIQKCSDMILITLSLYLKNELLSTEDFSDSNISSKMYLNLGVFKVKTKRDPRASPTAK